MARYNHSIYESRTCSPVFLSSCLHKRENGFIGQIGRFPYQKDRKIQLSTILEDQNFPNPALHSGAKNQPPLQESVKILTPTYLIPNVCKSKRILLKSGVLTTVAKDSVLTKLPHGRYPNAFDDYERDVDWRYLTPIESERAQTVPDNYTEGYAESTRKALMGNGWTVDIIAHILSFCTLKSFFPVLGPVVFLQNSENNLDFSENNRNEHLDTYSNKNKSCRVRRNY